MLARFAITGKQKPSNGAWSEIVWNCLHYTTTTTAVSIANGTASKMYEILRRSEPPRNVTHPGCRLPEAIAWTLLSNFFSAMSMLAAERTITRCWLRHTGTLPPGSRCD